MSLKVLTRWQSEQASATHEGAWHLVVGGAEYGLLLYWCSYYHNLLLLLLPSALLNNNEKTNKLGIYYSPHLLFVLKFAKSTSDEFRGSSGGGSFLIHLNNKRCILCILRSKYDPDMSRDWKLDQAGLLPQGAQMLREYHRMMDGESGFHAAHFQSQRGMRNLHKACHIPGLN